MCELLALNSNVPIAPTFSFAGFSARGGQTGHHVDGWGIGFHDTDGCRVFIDSGRACDAPLADFLRNHPPRARTFLAHVRKATQGAVTLSNCHPFQRAWRGRHWLFCHNGDLESFNPRLKSPQIPVGTTDSERAFCWLLQELDRIIPGGRPPGSSELFRALCQLVPRIEKHGTFNFILSDGHALVAHCSTELAWLSRRHPFEQVRLVDTGIDVDLAQLNQPDDVMVVVATAALTQGEPWQPMVPGELRLFERGVTTLSHQIRRLNRARPINAEDRSNPETVSH